MKVKQAHLLGAALLASIPLLGQAQLLSRGETQLTDSTNTLGALVNNQGFGHWQIASPDGNLPADPVNGLAATAQVVYATFVEENPATLAAEIVMRKSIDGGLTWAAPQAIYTIGGSEQLNTGGTDTRIHASGHNVVVVFLSNAHDTAQSGQSGWAIGSADQGQTWSSPILFSTRSMPGSIDPFFDLDEMRAVLDGDYLHVCFEVDYVNNPSGTGTAGNGTEDLFYSQLQFAGGAFSLITSDVRIDAAHAAGSVDVDGPEIDADGPIVTIVWSDDRRQLPDQFGQLTYQNDTYSRTSIAFGSDFDQAGQAPEINHTNYQSLLVLTWAAPRQPNVRVIAPNVLVFMEDSRDQQSDAVYCDISLNAGSTYAHTGVRVSTNPAGEDVDGFIVSDDGERVAIFTKTDRAGTNAVNQGYVNVGDLNDLINGTLSEATCSPAQDLVLYDVRIQGDVVAAVYESCGFPEEAYVGLSHDGGASFEDLRITNLGACSSPVGNADVDDVRVAISANRDVNVIWADDRNGPGNVREDVFLTSAKVPALVDNTSQVPPGVGGTMELVDLGPRDVGDWAFLMISGGGTAPGMPLGPSVTNAFQPRLAQDFWFNALLGDVTFVLETVGTDPMTGEARALFDGVPPFGIPNLRLLIGQSFWVAAGTADTNTLEFKYFTDSAPF